VNLAEKLTMLHLACSRSTYTFSRYMRAFEDNKLAAEPLVPAALDQVPTQAIHCRDDNYSHFSESVELGRRHPQLALRLLRTGGHLQIFNDATAVAEPIISFIDAAGGQTGSLPATPNHRTAGH
jgi:hypothetical protein